MFSLNEVVSNVKETVLNAYGWHTVDTDDYLDQTIQPGETVWFYDDEMDTWGFGIYEGWYQDYSRARDTSPYFCESNEGIDRLVITDCVINPDGTITLRRNYALAENVFGGYEATARVFNLAEVA
jgi:hypothetical protein